VSKLFALEPNPGMRRRAEEATADRSRRRVPATPWRADSPRRRDRRHCREYVHALFDRSDTRGLERPRARAQARRHASVSREQYRARQPRPALAAMVGTGTSPRVRRPLSDAGHSFDGGGRGPSNRTGRTGIPESLPEIVVTLLLGNRDQGLSVAPLLFARLVQRTHTSADHCHDRRRAARRNPAPSIVCVIRATGWTNARNGFRLNLRTAFSPAIALRTYHVSLG
jgi:hypothetical protein